MTERIESVKAGILASGVFGITDGVIIFLNHSLERRWQLEFPLWELNSLVDLGLPLAIAVGSGFLFGVTYRYIIRSEINSHLQDGAVLAFGLVRGFALIEGTNFTLLWFLLVVESILSFAIARLSLDYALQVKLIKPYL